MPWMILLFVPINQAVTTLPLNGTTKCGNLTCFNNAQCVDDKCRCKVGYRGATCFDDQDECKLGDPCLHRGNCVNSIGSYRCDCLDGWSGDIHCKTKVNKTDWKCTPGWTGDMCMDQCLNDSMCQTNKICIKRRDRFLCLCDSGWLGENCNIDKDECKSNVCQNKAVCINTPGSYKCHCLAGWNGYKCHEDIDECLDSPCLHSSTCTNAQGYYNCSCAKGWKGKNCSEDIDECKSGPCSARKTCNNTIGSFECSCNLGFQGADCDIDIDECKLSPCKNNGTCKNTFGNYKCTCLFGWQGCNCDIDINECESSPCDSTLVCRNIPGSFSCIKEQSISTALWNVRTMYTIIGTALISLLFGLSVTAFIGIMKMRCDVIHENILVKATDMSKLQKSTGRVNSQRYRENKNQERTSTNNFHLSQQQNLQFHVHVHQKQSNYNLEHTKQSKQPKNERQLELEHFEENEFGDTQLHNNHDEYPIEEDYQGINVQQDDQHQQEVSRQRFWLRRLKRYFIQINNPLWRY